jgi:molybdopterin-guanine dinucleotide biosynthesis protein A
MGMFKALVDFGGQPLIMRPIIAARAAGLDPVVIAKTEIDVGVPTWLDEYKASHPLSGLVTALKRGPCVAIACDQPFVTPELLEQLAEQPGFAITAGEPFPGRYEPHPILEQALAEEAPLRATLARLNPVELPVDPDTVISLNTLGELNRALLR